MRNITPFLWFDGKAEEAMLFYTSIFPNSKITSTNYNRDEGASDRQVITVSFEIQGQDFMAINGGPMFTFSPAISFFVNCEIQEEIDNLWEKLSEGGEKSRCGWLKDKYGISWQIVPTILGELLGDSDPVKSGRVMQAMLTMDKLDIDGLKRAYEQ